MATNNAVNNAPNANLAQHSVPVVGAAGLLSSIGPLTNGQLAIGSTSNAPVAGNLTSTGGSIAITNGPGTINLETTGGQGITRIVRQVITSSGTYTPTAGMLYADVELIGGGGGGGGVVASTETGVCGGVGGGCGGYTCDIFTAAEIGAGVAVVIGTGGAGGTTSGTNGTTGGTSTIVALSLQATGGVGGLGMASASAGSTIGGMIGGSGSGGQINVGGNPSDTSINYQTGYIYGGMGSNGGTGIYGGGGLGQYYDGAGHNATGYGAGGGGAASSDSLTAFAGGNGFDGVCIIVEYCS